MKALLFALIRAFEFELAIPTQNVLSKSTLIQRPMVAGDMGYGSQMPLLIKAYQA